MNIGQRRYPDFLIVGAQKSGTTTLHRLLDQCDDIYTTRPKELDFFSKPEVYKKGIDWYADCFLEAGAHQLCGEASPNYMYIDGSIERIASHLTQTKIICILREPVSRSFSHYLHCIRFGYDRHSFEAALQLEPKRISTDLDSNIKYSYFSRSSYDRQLKNLEKYIGPNNLLLLSMKQLAKDQFEVLNICRSFLGLNMLDARTDPITVSKANIALYPKNALVHQLIGTLSDSRIRKTLLNLNNRSSEIPKMSEDTEDMLKNKFSTMVDKLKNEWDLVV